MWMNIKKVRSDKLIKVVPLRRLEAANLVEIVEVLSRYPRDEAGVQEGVAYGDDMVSRSGLSRSSHVCLCLRPAVRDVLRRSWRRGSRMSSSKGSKLRIVGL